MTCDDAQIAFEMHRHGAADRATWEAAASHIGSCRDCQDTTARMQRMDDMIKMTSANEMDSIDWGRVQRRFDAARRRLGRGWWRLGLGGLLAALLIVVMNQVGLPADSAVFAGAFVLGLAAWQLRRTHRELHRVASRGDVIGFLRTDLDRQIAHARRNVWLGPVAAVTLGSLGPVLVWVWGESSVYLAVSGLTVAVMLADTIASAWKLPRLRRERAELG